MSENVVTTRRMPRKWAWTLRVGVLVAALGGATAAARAAGLETWRNGDLLTADGLNAGFAELQKQIQALRVPVTSAWATYTPIVTGATTGNAVPNLISTGSWRRVGDTIELSVHTAATGAATSADAFWEWSLPSGVKVDEARFPSKLLGAAGAYAKGSTVTCFVIVAGGGSKLDVLCQGFGGFVGPGVPEAWAAGSAIELTAGFPVVGWGVN